VNTRFLPWFLPVTLGFPSETPSSAASASAVPAVRRGGPGTARRWGLLCLGRITTFRKMRLPVSLELLELLATVKIPQQDRLVTRPTDELRWIRRVELDAGDIPAAIFSNVSFSVNFSTPLPR